MRADGTLTDVPGVRVGHAHDERALTGCTVVVLPHGAVAGVEVRGGAPGTRELALLDPTAMVERIDAVCLAGGSAFGLRAADGVTAWCEENGLGFRAGAWIVPIVPSAIVFDLMIGDGTIRPTAAMGYAAARSASSDPVAQGNVGAGCGATVGKLRGIAHAMKGGIGSASRRLAGGLVVGALVVVNAFGEIRDPRTGTAIAGTRDDDGAIADSVELFATLPLPLPATNTTLAVVAVNANFTKADATVVARMAHDGFARCIFPVHTSYDGDTVFALATGGVDVRADVVGSIATECVAEAIVRGTLAARAAGGLPAAAPPDG